MRTFHVLKFNIQEIPNFSFILFDIAVLNVDNGDGGDLENDENDGE